MKKSRIVLLFTFILAFTVTACSGNSSNNNNNSESVNETETDASNADQPILEEGAKLLVWEEATEIPFIEEAAKAFKEQYGVEVTVEAVPGPDQSNRLANDGPAGLGADIVMFPHDKLGNTVQAGLLLPNDVFGDETIASHPEASIQASSFDGILYGYPKSIETYAMFYNKDLIDSPPATWDEVKQFAQSFTDKNANKFGVMWEARLLYFNHMFLAANGGYVFGKNGTDPSDIGLNKPESVKGIQYFQSLQSILPLKAENITGDIKTQLFQEGKLALNIDGQWAIGSFKDKLNFGVAPLPELPDGKKSISFSGVRSYYVNSYTKYPNAAKQFANFLTNSENALKNFKMTGILPSNSEAAAKPEIANDPILSGFSEQFKNSRPMPSIPELNNVWDPAQGAFTTIWNDNADVQKTMDDAVKTIQEQIAGTTAN